MAGPLWRRVGYAALLVAITGCSKKEASGGGFGVPQRPVIEETGDQYDPRAFTQNVAAEELVDPNAPSDPPAMFLAPEQVEKHLKTAFNYEHGWTDGEGVFHSAILDYYRIALGGIDFESATVRDPHPKVNTLLVVRNLAYDIAWGIVGRASREESPDKSVFALCEIRTDRPYDAGDAMEEDENVSRRLLSEKRWLAQVEELYWRAYGRAPSREEKAAVRTTFMKVGRDWPPEGWALVLYALMSTAEFWSL